MRKIGFLAAVLTMAGCLSGMSVHAAGQESVTLTSEQEKIAIDVVIADESCGVTTLCVRVEADGEVANLNSGEPFKFVEDDSVKYTLMETRYDPEQQYFTLYLSDVSEITDRSSFRLGYIIPNKRNSEPALVELSVEEKGFEYVDVMGNLHDKVTIPPSVAVLSINQIQENQQGDPADSAESSGQEKPGETVKTGDSGFPARFFIAALFSLVTVLITMWVRRNRRLP